MKFAKITLGIILGIILIVWIVGLVAGEVKYEVAVEVDAPAEVAWEIFTTDSLMPDWLTGLKSVEHLEGTPLTPGSKFRLIFEDQGNRYEMIETVTAVEINKRFAFASDSDFMTSQSDITFSSKDGKTIISDISSFQAKGFVFKAVLPFMSDAMAERSRTVYINLAHIINNKNQERTVEGIESTE